MKVPSGDLYVSAVEGHLVSRFGSAVVAGQKAAQFGATKVFLERPDGTRRFKGVKWDTERVYRIPEASYREFFKEYDAALEAGALRKRTEKDFAAWKAKSTAAKAAAAKKEETSAASANTEPPAAAKAAEENV